MARLRQWRRCGTAAAHKLTSSSAKSRRTRMSVNDWRMRFQWDSVAALGCSVVTEVFMIRPRLSSGTPKPTAEPVIAPSDVGVVHGPFIPLISAQEHLQEGRDVREPDPARSGRPGPRTGFGRPRLGTAEGHPGLGRQVEPDLRADQR